MEITCPNCGEQIPSASVNVQTDVAACEVCDEVHVLSNLVPRPNTVAVDLDSPPHGAWLHDLAGEWQVGATTRSPMAVFLLPFMCVWSGGSLGPVIGIQIARGFDLDLSLFGLPFLITTLILGPVALMTAFGKSTVSVSGHQALVFEGVGPIGWRRNVNWEDIEIAEQDSFGNLKFIALVGTCRRLIFGMMLNTQRRDFVLQALRQKLIVTQQGTNAEASGTPSP